MIDCKRANTDLRGQTKRVESNQGLRGFSVPRRPHPARLTDAFSEALRSVVPEAPEQTAIWPRRQVGRSSEVGTARQAE